MTARQDTRDAGMGVSFIFSTVIHLAVFLLMLWWGRVFPMDRPIQETYYVDIVNLPVANPRSGSPSQKGHDAEAPSTPQSSENPMNLPGKQRLSAKAAEKQDASDSAFAKKMAKLENRVESQQQEAALERLRTKLTTSGSGRSGTPGGSGSQIGSDYTAYIQSRLKDAFGKTISFTSKKPEMVVRLTISTDGRISRTTIERSSGDRAFELAVTHAIDIAGEKFPPPPSHKAFEGVFVFRPQGISNSKP
jgi:colicin import membrane protein